MTKSQLKQLIAENQIKKAIQAMLEITAKLGDSDLQNEVVQQSAKFNDYLKEKAAGTTSQENLDIQKAKIDNALMYIVDKLPDSIPQRPADLKTQPPHSPATRIRLFLFAGIGLALLTFFTIQLLLRPNGGQFEYTVNLRGPNLPDYPPLQGATVLIQVGNHWEEAAVDEFGDADFKGIAADFANKPVFFQVKSDFWEQTQDSIWLEGKTCTIEVRPNGTLETVSGNVRSGDGSEYLEGVEIRLENSNISILSDSNGYFELHVPVAFQKEQYSITATKTGYVPQSLFAHPTGNFEIRLQPKK